MWRSAANGYTSDGGLTRVRMISKIKNPTLAWHVLWLVMSFNLMSFCTHTVFCWVYASCSSYPPSTHVVLYIMRMGDFSYGLLCGIVLVHRLNSRVQRAPCEQSVSEANAPGKSEIAISC